MRWRNVYTSLHIAKCLSWRQEMWLRPWLITQMENQHGKNPIDKLSPLKCMLHLYVQASHVLWCASAGSLICLTNCFMHTQFFIKGLMLSKKFYLERFVMNNLKKHAIYQHNRLECIGMVIPLRLNVQIHFASVCIWFQTHSIQYNTIKQALREIKHAIL